MTPYEQKIETVARAICQEEGFDPDLMLWTSHVTHPSQYPTWHDFRPHAIKALAALGITDTAPAPAISGGEMVNVPRDALQTLIEQADAMAFERNTQDYEQFGRPQYIEDAYGWLAALAAAGQKP